MKLCDPWCIEGLHILASRPKLGKTTLERQKLIAAASGGPFLDSSFTNPTLCAFLCLEEGESLCRMKFREGGFSDAGLAAVQLFFDWPRGTAGVDLLDRYLTANPDVGFVVIDSLAKFRSIPDVRTPAFMADYEAVGGLHSIVKAHKGVAIDLVHHTRKGKSDDPIDDISGTYGLTAAADSYAVMRHHADGALMYVGGRIWTRESDCYKLVRENRAWKMIGPNLGLTDKQAETLELVRAEAAGMSGIRLGEKLAITTPSAWQRLDELIEHGVAVKRNGKVYAK